MFGMTRVLEWMYTSPFGKASWEDKEEELCSMQRSGLNAWSFALKWVMSQLRAYGQSTEVRSHVDGIMVGVCYRLPDKVE